MCTPFKIVCLGGKTTNKDRPLLLSIDDLDIKASIPLCVHISYNVTINTRQSLLATHDRTKLECEKNKKAVEELKGRHANGEKGLIMQSEHV